MCVGALLAQSGFLHIRSAGRRRGPSLPAPWCDDDQVGGCDEGGYQADDRSFGVHAAGARRHHEEHHCRSHAKAPHDRAACRPSGLRAVTGSVPALRPGRPLLADMPGRYPHTMTGTRPETNSWKSTPDDVTVAQRDGYATWRQAESPSRPAGRTANRRRDEAGSQSFGSSARKVGPASALRRR